MTLRYYKFPYQGKAQFYSIQYLFYSEYVNTFLDVPSDEDFIKLEYTLPEYFS